MLKMDYGYVVYGKENNSSTLTILTLTLSSVGLFLSIIALFLLFLTAFLFQQWREVYKNQLLIQFMIARFIFTFVRYMYDIFNAYDFETPLDPIIVCIFLMIYTEVTLVGWTFVFSKHMYDSFVNVCNAEYFSMWKVSVSAWMAPLFVSVLLYGLYSIPAKKDFLFLLVYLVFVKWPILCVNGIQLVLILKYILNINRSKTEHNLRIVLVMILLIFTFSIQHALGDIHKFFLIIMYNRSDHAMLVFTLTNIATIYQCGFTILFWLFGNAYTRKLWTFKHVTNVNSLS